MSSQDTIRSGFPQVPPSPGQQILDWFGSETVLVPDGSVRAQCPACAAAGHDHSGDHLALLHDGRFGCAAHPGNAARRAEVHRLAGTGKPTHPHLHIRLSIRPKRHTPR